MVHTFKKQFLTQRLPKNYIYNSILLRVENDNLVF
jgi:hypothetical protein